MWAKAVDLGDQGCADVLWWSLGRRVFLWAKRRALILVRLAVIASERPDRLSRASRLMTASQMSIRLGRGVIWFRGKKGCELMGTGNGDGS